MYMELLCEAVFVNCIATTFISHYIYTHNLITTHSDVCKLSKAILTVNKEWQAVVLDLSKAILTVNKEWQAVVFDLSKAILS